MRAPKMEPKGVHDITNPINPKSKPACSLAKQG